MPRRPNGRSCRKLIPATPRRSSRLMSVHQKGEVGYGSVATRLGVRALPRGALSRRAVAFLVLMTRSQVAGVREPQRRKGSVAIS
jgi:hypothetical protein